MIALFATPAYALPIFARQTGSPCSACHTSFPELNAFGRSFKLRGYTLTESELSGFSEEEDKSTWLPIGGMVVTSYSRIKSQDVTETVEFSKDKELALQEASAFLGGKINQNTGAFLQFTYDGIERHSSLDIVDIRYSDRMKIDDKDLIYGITLNNDPTAQDVWNSMPAWSFPYTGSDSAPGPAATLIEDGLGQQVGGLGIYALWDNRLYGELSLYRQGATGIFRLLTQGSDVGNIVKGTAPYWRFAYQRDLGNHYFMTGLFGMSTSLYAEGLSEGPSNKYSDIGVDAQYEFKKDTHEITASASWIREKQTWNADFASGNTEEISDTLKNFKAKISYYFNHYVGGTLGYFQTTGSTNAELYAPDPVEGSNAGKPNSSGFVMEVGFTPLELLKTGFSSEIFRVGLQYVMYDEFNGSKDNYDGFGRNASDNNTLYLYGWLAF
ncbi:MAG: hypothetical protein BWK79_05795 [Beggiatoa sp. IS2]|nr:MAG: hypothetical protein BWK79_05795 [Beggiatoa sp. IS2]